MIRGMTGFGSAQVASGKAKILVEIKSVNHRYLDITCFLPTGFGAVEDKITNIVKKTMERGRVNVSVRIAQRPQQNIKLDKDIVKQHLKFAGQLKKEFKLTNDLTLSHLMTLPGVLEMKEEFVDPESLWPKLEKGVTQALQAVLGMRKREGQSLVKDLRAQVLNMKGQIKSIRQRIKNIWQQQKAVLTDDEFKIFQKNSDVNEELTRLGHYLNELNKLLLLTVSIGKQMDFMAQEMQRETNTIGAKVQDKVVSDCVIVLKSNIEKIREQAQNVE